MKKLILIWVGIIALLIVGGILYGKVFGLKKEEEKPKTEITYLDDDGNEIKEEVDDAPVTVTIDGTEYTYNSAIWREKDLVIDGDTFSPKHYKANFTDKGYKEGDFSLFSKDENHNIYIQYNSYYDHIFSIHMYSHPFNESAMKINAYCDDVVLPANVKLGVSTKDYVEKIYGKSAEAETKTEDLIIVKYYATADKSGERLVLSYDKNTNVLCGIEWSFNVN